MNKLFSCWEHIYSKIDPVFERLLTWGALKLLRIKLIISKIKYEIIRIIEVKAKKIKYGT